MRLSLALVFVEITLCTAVCLNCNPYPFGGRGKRSTENVSSIEVPDVDTLFEANVRVLGYQPNKEENCAGSLISTKHVLTAAHCFFDKRPICHSSVGPSGDVVRTCDRTCSFKPSEWNTAIHGLNDTIVEVSGTCLRSSVDCPEGTESRVVGVSRVFIPQSYIDSNCLHSDVAILELTEPVERKHVVLDRAENYPPFFYASGYGEDPNENATEPNYLLTVQLTPQECPDDEGLDLNETLCMAEVESNVCKGDDGAALRDLDGVIYGVSSYGTDCHEMNDALKEHKGNEVPLPKWKGAVFTKIAAHLPFICNIIGETENEGCAVVGHSVSPFLH